MKKISILLLLFLLVSLFACKERQRLDIRKFVQNEFKIENKGVLDSDDSCLLVQFMIHVDLNKYKGVDLLKGFHTRSITCPYNNFTFSLIDRPGSERTEFYGQFDVYYMRYSSTQADSGKLIHFQNQSLIKLIQRDFGVDDLPAIKTFLSNVYTEERQGELVPLFDDAISIDSVKDIVSKATYVDLTNFAGDNHFIFIGRNLGLIIFAIDIKDKQIRVREGLIPFRKFKYFQNDVLPDYYKPCR